MREPSSHASQILSELADGDESAAARLFPLVYHELRALAACYFQRQPLDHTLQPTALVHEAFLRLVEIDEVRWRSRAHFLAVAAKAMRQLLIDHARKRTAVKRGGEWNKITLDEAVAITNDRMVDLMALNQALEDLEGLNERQSRVVELRFFGSLTIAETARVLGVGTTAVETDWAFAKAWLGRKLGEGPEA